ncbi:MAG TPA: peptidoglycan editing factor PgeF [Tepidisphaeraceae bacterium]|nr:peptidoglycan editing factor PgeF [Tepidisphaeraceae bacterium]
MLQRKTSQTGVVYYVSPLMEALGVPHAFSTRIGGVSPAPFDSLNLGNPLGCPTQDDQANIRQNYQRLAEAAGFAGRRIQCVRQVHGSSVVTVTGHNQPSELPQADGLITEDATCVVSVRVADCVPVLLCTGDGRKVAAVHAGWRGVVAGVVPQAIQLMERPRVELIAAIGPCISMEAFEVGPEVLEQFVQLPGQEAPILRRADGKGHVDLRKALFLQLLRAGLRADRIDLTDRCTYLHSDEFFSHRREKGLTGRLAALISPHF